MPCAPHPSQRASISCTLSILPSIVYISITKYCIHIYYQVLYTSLLPSCHAPHIPARGPPSAAHCPYYQVLYTSLLPSIVYISITKYCIHLYYLHAMRPTSQPEGLHQLHTVHITKYCIHLYYQVLYTSLLPSIVYISITFMPCAPHPSQRASISCTLSILPSIVYISITKYCIHLYYQVLYTSLLPSCHAPHIPARGPPSAAHCPYYQVLYTSLLPSIVYISITKYCIHLYYLHAMRPTSQPEGLHQLHTVHITKYCIHLYYQVLYTSLLPSIVYISITFMPCAPHPSQRASISCTLSILPSIVHISITKYCIHLYYLHAVRPTSQPEGLHQLHFAEVSSRGCPQILHWGSHYWGGTEWKLETYIKHHCRTLKQVVINHWLFCVKCHVSCTFSTSNVKWWRWVGWLSIL